MAQSAISARVRRHPRHQPVRESIRQTRVQGEAGRDMTLLHHGRGEKTSPGGLTVAPA